MRIIMRFNPTKVTNFVGVVFCTFVQRFRSSENTFFENFCRSRTQADNEMQILLFPPEARSDGIHIFLFVLIESEVSFLFLEGA